MKNGKLKINITTFIHYRNLYNHLYGMITFMVQVILCFFCRESPNGHQINDCNSILLKKCTLKKEAHIR